MNPSCTQTNLVLDGLFALLACGKCKQTPERPVRFVNCGHFFCNSCVENDTVCRQCCTSVKSNEKRPYNTIARLINYCTTIKEMISNLDEGDLWPLANAIHQLTTDQGEKIEESVSYCNVVKEAAGSKKNENYVLEPAENSIDSVQTLRCQKNLQSENTSILNSLRISKNHENNDLLGENVSFIDSPRISEKHEENYLHRGNVSFVHSTQINARHRREEAQSETPGYIDPTQISPIRKQVDSDSETPGYRDPTQVIRQVNDSNYDPETPGYRDPTQISPERDDGNSADETVGYVGPTQVTPLAKKTSRKIHCENDIELGVEDTDLFSPIPESKSHDTLVPETPDMDASISESTIIPETLDVDTMYDDRVTLIVANTRDSDRETKKLARHIEKIKTLQRKTYPMSDYDTIGIENIRDSGMHAVESVGKTPLRFNRRLTDPTLDRRNQGSTDDFDTRSVPDVRDSFMDDVHENENMPIEALEKKNNLALNKRQTRISLNERWTPRIANGRDEFLKTLNREDESMKQNARDFSVDRRNWITTNDSETSSAKEAPPKQLRRIRDLKLDRHNKIPINPHGTLDVGKGEDFTNETGERILDFEKENFDDGTTSVGDAQDAIMENYGEVQPSRLRYTRNALLTRSIGTALNDRNALGVDSERNSIMETVDVQKQRPIKHPRRLSDWEVDRQIKTWNNCETMDIPFTYNDAEAKKEASVKPLRHRRNSILDRQNKTSTNIRDTRDLAKMESMERVNQIGRIKNRAMHRLNEDSFSDRDTIGLADGADLLETAAFETESNDEDSPMKRQNKLPMTKTSIAKVQDTAMEIKESADEKPLPTHLQRLTDWPLNRQERDSRNYSDTVDFTKIGDSIMEFEIVPEIRPLRQLRRLHKKPANHTVIPNDLHDLDITNIQDFDKEKLPNKCPTNESDTVDISNVEDLLDEPQKITEVRPLRQLGRLQKSKLDHRSIMATDLHGVDITNIYDFDEGKQQNECAMNESDTADVSNVDDPLEESRKLPEVKPLRQLRQRLQRSKQDHRSIIASDLHGVHLTNINDYGNEKQPNECPINESDTVDASNFRVLLDESQKIREVRPLRKLRRLQKLKPDNRSIIASDLRGVDITNIQAFGQEERQQNECPMDESDTADIANVGDSREKSKVTSLKHLRSPEKAKPDDRSIIASDLHGVDITNIQDFSNDKHPNECPMDESDTVDVSNVGDLLDRTEQISKVKPLKQVRRLQKSKPNSSCSIVAKDLRRVDVTNIQDFGQEKQPDEYPMSEPDTVDVSNVEDLLDEPQKIPEVKPLRQLGRLQKFKSNHESIHASNVHGPDTTNSEKFTKGQAPLVEKTPMRYENLSKKRPSRSPPNDCHTAGTSDTETTMQTPLKQLRSVENLELETQNKIPAKRARAKIVQLKPRRRTNDKAAAVPKIIPKNVNKRNVKGETVLHNACVKGQAEYVRALLEAGANPNTKDNANWTPLQEVVKLGKREICEMLLQFGASPNTPGIENRTALHDASQNDKLEEATVLLRFNANRDVYDKFGKRPIDYAKSEEMRVLLADDHAVEKMIGEAPGMNVTLDQSIITPNTKVVVLPANLNSANKKILSKIASKLKVTVAASFRPGVTHIVVEANERNNADLTHHVMFAILQGIWILNSQWIAISMDLRDISEIDLELFEVHGAPNPGTPERSRMNEEKQNPRLFNNCFFYFTIGARVNWNYGNLEFTKASLTKLVLAGQGEVLRREPDPEDVKDNEITPFHVADKPTHSLHRCSHYIIYMPGKDEPRIKYNMPHIKTLPLAWLIECIEKFALVDPVLIGIS